MNEFKLPDTPANVDICRYKLHFKHDPAQLPDLLASVLAFVATISSDYIWHKQAFNLVVHESPVSRATASLRTGVWDSGGFKYLEGKTDVTDCVDDEWFIVWLLREISKVWHDVVISVEDSDGQFLLIEGAEELPKWVTPINATNRTFVYQGKLHLIPLEHSSALPFEQSTHDNDETSPELEEGFLDLSLAISLVRSGEADTTAPTNLQDTVWNRVSDYPAQIKKHLHRTLAYLPVEVALALQEDRSLISDAVAAFYEREPATMKACNSMTRFPPASPSSAFVLPAEKSTSKTASPGTVLVPVIMTKPLYSQLVLQRFFPPKPFEKVGWLESGVQGPEDERRRSVGMKIACGFEMLYKSTSSHLRISSADRDPSSDPRYKIFLNNLKKRNYFEDQVQGSKIWLEKERKVRESWLRSTSASTSTSPKSRPFAQRVDEVVATFQESSTALQNWLSPRVFANTSPQEVRSMEDDESWLVMDEQGFEEMLKARGPGAEGLGGLDDELESDSDSDNDENGSAEDGQQHNTKGMGDERPVPSIRRKGSRLRSGDKEEKRTNRAAKHLQEMAEKVENFVEGRGAVEGAEFSDEMSSDEDDDDIDAPFRRPQQLSAEERAKRTAALIQPLPAEEWGSKSGDSRATNGSRSTDTATALPLPLPARPAKLTSNKYDGASSDDSSEAEEDDEMFQLDPSLKLDPSKEYDQGEDGPSLVDRGEELDMHEEMDEFLSFARDTLGLSQEQYEKILGDRTARGAFVPGPTKPKTTNVIPSREDKDEDDGMESMDIPEFEGATAVKPQLSGPLRNPNLKDFDALMEQMDNVLAKSKSTKGSKVQPQAPLPPHPAKQPHQKSRDTTLNGSPLDPSPLIVESDEDDEDDPMESTDAELASLFKSVGGGEADETPMDYNLVKSFLESFQNQGGFGGPAGNLAGRLGFPLPRDA